MKTSLSTFVILLFCLTMSGQDQTMPYSNYSSSSTAFRNVNPYQITNTIDNQKNVLAAELFGGFKGALICTGVFTLSALISASSYGGALSGLGPTGFLVGIFGMGISAVSLPFIISLGVNKAAVKYGFPDKYKYALVGPLLAGAATLAIVFKMYSESIYMTTTFIAPISALVILPIASVTSYNVIGHKMKEGASLSLLNINKGKIKIGTPIPAVYPNPLMQGKISSQISIMKISL